MRSTLARRKSVSSICPSSNFSQHFRAVGHGGTEGGDAWGFFCVPVLYFAVISPDTRKLSNVILECNSFGLGRRRDI